MSSLRLALVIPTASGGGIGPVCLYAAEELSRQHGWSITVVCLHDAATEEREHRPGVRFVSLGLSSNCPTRFLEWINDHPQDVVITNDVSRIEEAFCFLPRETIHIVQIHDNLKRYRQVALRNVELIDGVTCVARHIEEKLRHDLSKSTFRGVIGSVHNGAVYPPQIPRKHHSGPLRLLYMGRLDPFKGIFDLVSLLRELKRRGVLVSLTIVGGESYVLRKSFERYHLEDSVQWSGLIPHEQCYATAAESDILLMTSRKEPFGMVTIEAMSMGCVPMAYEVASGSAEIIENNRSGLLVPLGDIKKWTDLIQELDQDRSRLNELSTGAITRARSRFSAAAMAEGLATFVLDVLENAKTHPANRAPGTCPETDPADSPGRKGYQLFPPGVRTFVRNAIGKNAKLCHWILNRY